MTFTKRASAVFAGYTAGGAARQTDPNEAAVWGSEVEAKVDVFDTPTGVNGDGVNYDTDAINNAVAAAPMGGEIYLPSGKSFLVSGLSNARGIKFSGGGKIVFSTGGGTVQANDYGRKMGFVVGREYRQRLFARLNVAGTTLTGFIYGDSTVATSANGGGYAGAAGEPHTLLTKQFKRSNVRNPISLTNRGVGGSNWSSSPSPLSDLGPATDLMIFKYSINQVSPVADKAAAAVAELAAARAKIASIRAASYGSVSDLTIVIVGPSSTFDPAGGRTNVFYEYLRGGFEQIARDYKCMYLDAYGYMPDSSHRAGLDMDTPAVHLTGNGQGILWAWIGNEIIAPNENQLNVNDDWVAFSGLNGWGDYGGGFASSVVSISPDGWVRTRIAVKRSSGAASGGQPFGQLPNQNYYPPSPIVMPAGVTYNGSSWSPIVVIAQTDGTIAPSNADANNTLVVIDGMSWRVW